MIDPKEEPEEEDEETTEVTLEIQDSTIGSTSTLSEDVEEG